MASRDGAGAMFWRGAAHRPGEDAWRPMGFRQGLVDVFEYGLGSDSSDAVGGLDEVVAGATGLFAAECVDEDERFGELTGAHQETGTIDGPLAFRIHKCFLSLIGGAGVGCSLQVLTGHDYRSVDNCFQSGVTVRAQRGWVNTIRIVQPWISGAWIRCDESGSSFGRRQLRLAHEGRGLSGGREIARRAFASGGRDLHTGCTG